MKSLLNELKAIKASPFVEYVFNLALKLDRGKIYKILAEQVKDARSEGHKMTLDDLYQSAVEYLTYTKLPKLEDTVVAKLAEVLTNAISPWGGLVHPDRTSLTLKWDKGLLDISGSFEGADYADEDGDVEVPTEVQDTKINQKLQSLGVSKHFLRWGLDHHDQYSDMGRIEYNIHAVWTFDPKSLARKLLDDRKLKSLLK